MKEFDFTVEYSKVLINLAVLVLGITLTFFRTIVVDTEWLMWPLLLVWLRWVSSIYCGALSIREITKILSSGDVEDYKKHEDIPDQLSVFNDDVQKYLRCQRLSFISGFVVFIAAAFISMLL